MMMTHDEQINRLHWRLSRQSGGPLDVIANQAVGSLAVALRTVTTWLRESTKERPLIALLLSFEAGYALARLGRSYAQR
jgi:hypothetical protein